MSSPGRSPDLPALYRVADSFRIPGMDRDDRRQEAVLIALEALRDGAAVEHLTTIVRRRLIDLQDRFVRREASNDEGFREPIDAAPGPAQQAETNELRERCRAALSPGEFAVVECLFFDGLTIPQTADVLGLSADAVKAARSRGLKKVRHFFG